MQTLEYFVTSAEFERNAHKYGDEGIPYYEVFTSSDGKYDWSKYHVTNSLEKAAAYGKRQPYSRITEQVDTLGRQNEWARDPKHPEYVRVTRGHDLKTELRESNPARTMYYVRMRSEEGNHYGYVARLASGSWDVTHRSFATLFDSRADAERFISEQTPARQSKLSIVSARISNPIHRVSGGWQWGKHGHVYRDRAGAVRQAEAAHAHGFREKNSMRKGESDYPAGLKNPGRYVVRGIPVNGGQSVFYTGKAGSAYISRNLSDAFPYELWEGAIHRAQILNRMSAIHGLKFEAQVVPKKSREHNPWYDGLDIYREHDSRESHPYRIKLNGSLLKTEAGSIRKFRTLHEATEWARKQFEGRSRNPSPSSPEVAGTILKQLGGGKFIAMTGARDLVYGPDMLQFRLPRGAKMGITRVRVFLTPEDLYKLEFWQIMRRGLDARMVAEFDGIYANQLQEIFTRVTGLDTHL